MRRYLLLIIICISCSQPDSSDTSVNQENEQTVENMLQHENLTSKVYEMGSYLYFTDSCKFIFECDCCKSDFSLNPDSTFYFLSYCTDANSLTTGKFKIDDDRLLFVFQPLRIDNTYNWESEADSMIPEYVMSDTSVNLPTITFRTEICGNNLKFVSDSGGKTIAISTANNYTSFIEKLNTDGYLDKLKKNENDES